MVDVLGDLVLFEASQLASPRHALPHLPHLRPAQQNVELRLPGQDHLQERRAVAVEIGPEAELLQQHGMQMLGFVDDHHRASAKRRQRGEKALQHDDQLMQRRRHDATRRPGITVEHAEVAEHLREQLLGGHARVQDQ